MGTMLWAGYEVVVNRSELIKSIEQLGLVPVIESAKLNVETKIREVYLSTKDHAAPHL